MIFSIANILIKLLGIDFDRATKYARIIFLAAACLIALVFGALIYSCEQKRAEKAKQKDEQNKIEIERDKGKIEILEKQENEIIEKEKQVNENSKQAETNFNSIIRRDSSDFNSNFNSAKRKFCEQPEFFNDSRCRQN